MQYKYKTRKKPAIIICSLILSADLVCLLPIILQSTELLQLHFIVYAVYSALFAALLAAFLILTGKFLLREYIYVIRCDSHPEILELHSIVKGGKKSVLVYFHILTENDSVIKKDKAKKKEIKKERGSLLKSYICELFSDKVYYLSTENEKGEKSCVALCLNSELANTINNIIERKKN